jgi:hypothetical protein
LSRKNNIYKEKFSNPERETFLQFLARNLNLKFNKTKSLVNGKLSHSKINIVNPIEMRPISKKPDNTEILRLNSIQPIEMDNFEMSSFESCTNIDSVDTSIQNKNE